MPAQPTSAVHQWNAGLPWICLVGNNTQARSHTERVTAVTQHGHDLYRLTLKCPLDPSVHDLDIRLPQPRRLGAESPMGKVIAIQLTISAFGVGAKAFLSTPEGIRPQRVAPYEAMTHLVEGISGTVRLS